MIDSKLKLEIEYDSRQSFESIASDLTACGDICLDDAVDSVVSDMYMSASRIVRPLTKFGHPDYDELRSIVNDSIKGYFRDSSIDRT